MSAIKPVDVVIMGREFTVSCTDEERQGLLDAVDYLDKKMHDIRDSGKVVGVERIAIMAALNLSHEVLNTKDFAAITYIVHFFIKIIDCVQQALTLFIRARDGKLAPHNDYINRFNRAHHDPKPNDSTSALSKLSGIAVSKPSNLLMANND